jgi:hypothetical protein
MVDYQPVILARADGDGNPLLDTEEEARRVLAEAQTPSE